MTQELILIGKIVAAHGIKGDVKVKSYTTIPTDFFNYTPIMNKDRAEIKIKLKSSNNSDVLIATIEDVKDRNTSETFKGVELFTFKSSIINEDENEILFSDLIGFKIIDDNNNEIGSVFDIQNYGGGDILEIKLINNEKTALISYNDASIIELNTKKGFIKIDQQHLLQD